MDNQFHNNLAFLTHRNYQYVVNRIFLRQKKKAQQNYSTINIRKHGLPYLFQGNKVVNPTCEAGMHVLENTIK